MEDLRLGMTVQKMKRLFYFHFIKSSRNIVSIIKNQMTYSEIRQS